MMHEKAQVSAVWALATIVLTLIFVFSFGDEIKQAFPRILKVNFWNAAVELRSP